MNHSIRDPLHTVDDGLPVLGQLLHPSVVEVDTVAVELSVWLATVVAEVVIGADDHVVIVYKVSSEAVSKGFPKAVIEL